jgi:hypothetical protein
MTSTVAALRRTFRLAWLCVFLVVPRVHAADTPLSADFDGDGKGDRVTFSLQEPDILRVWLSGSSTTHVIHSPEPLLAVAAADIDGDRRAELIATHSRPGLRVWTKKHGAFRAVHPVERSPIALIPSNDRAFDPGATPPVVATTDVRSPASCLAISLHPGEPILRGWAEAPALARGPTVSPYFSSFAPRPPPSSLI